MSDSTRRGFLKYTAAGAAATGAVAVAGSAFASDASAAPVTLPKGAKGAIVVPIEDDHRGPMSLMIEGHEVTITDPDLVARITHALHAAAAASV